ncbi:uncharacterized protein UMAG_05444 [Mycosarcoma maydis]|uniref:Uncharacterized protein n=1 Tax=Mycosarcoma maydis TaxID=5270 RepID=A0A0D1CHL5_MYCMD|nr:uncharacterized protein UMAG_05444 [Ustilago maydis 521]KIS66453.1 hypothetical protein UMAG_05444 [Ustilago maydis 521]|eukprot:XP_011391792.1 hypothetical protein UMAG_05444 [Ustilago maydis 521]
MARALLVARASRLGSDNYERDSGTDRARKWIRDVRHTAFEYAWLSQDQLTRQKRLRERAKDPLKVCDSQHLNAAYLTVTDLEQARHYDLAAHSQSNQKTHVSQ